MDLPTIKDGAIFISDAHYPHHGDKFFKLLCDIDSQKLNPTQIFLMGDIFDLLFGYNKYIKTFSQDAIELLDKISKSIDVFYLEGNHDFCLKDIFKHIHIYPQELQPVHFILGDKIVGLSHGDKYDTPITYKIYSKILRNRYTLKILQPFEKSIIDYRMDKLSSKDICHTFKGFKDKAYRIVESYSGVDLVIEGHFHQAKQLHKYISLPSLACQKQIAVIKNSSIVFEDI